MGQKDIVTKDIIKEIGRDISMYILGIDIQSEIELIDKEWTRVEKRESDIVFKYEKKIVHIEIQNNNHNKMELRMLRYLTDILFEYNGYEVSQYLIYIGQKNCTMREEIKQNRLSYSYDIIDVRDISCEELLYHKHPLAVALSILYDFEGKNELIKHKKALNGYWNWFCYQKSTLCYSYATTYWINLGSYWAVVSI
jgi:hypothetical protein